MYLELPKSSHFSRAKPAPHGVEDPMSYSRGSAGSLARAASAQRAVPVTMRSPLAMTAHDCLCARPQATLAGSKPARGLPKRLPLALPFPDVGPDVIDDQAALPATAPRTVKTIRPAGVEVSNFPTCSQNLHADFPFRARGALLAWVDLMRSAADAPSTDSP